MRQLLQRIIPVVLIVAYPFLVHASVVLKIPHLQIAAMLSFLLGACWVPLSQKRLGAWLFFAGMTAIILALASVNIALYLLYLPPIIFPLILLFIFGRTLLPGREALITHIGETSRGPLTPAMRRYTWWLTFAWCVVFVVMMAWSAILPWVARPELWSWFTNIINYGIVGVLFVGEFILRKIVFPEHNHPGFIEYLHIIIKANIRR